MRLYKIQDVKNIKYIGADDISSDQIPNSNFKEGVLVRITGYTLTKPFKLLIDGEAKVKGKRKRFKKQLEFSNGTMRAAIEDARVEYKLQVDSAKDSLKSINVDGDSLSDEVIPNFKQAFDDYISAKITRYKANNKKILMKNVDGVSSEFGEEINFCNRWLKPLFTIKLNEIKKSHLEKIMATMTDKDGNPLALRTKRKVYQGVNPVYTHILSNTEHIVKSPASMKGLGKLNNEKDVELSELETKELFNKLYSYEIPVIRNVFLYMMHGHRIGEILSLEWADVDLKANTYTIRAENTKARLSMTYALSNRLKSLFDSLDVQSEGFVFTAINDSSKALSSGTLRNHWKQDITLHDMRHIIGNFLVNRGVSLEIIGAILGHTPVTGNITSRYARVNRDTVAKTLDDMFDELIDVQE